MGLFFGTDGLRGVVNDDLTGEIAYKCGRALAAVTDSPRVLIGRDTRVSGEYLTLGVAMGVMSGGGDVTDLGVIPTSGVAYLTRVLGADYGVVISASHNPREYNGIKVFDRNGYKLSDGDEERLERTFLRRLVNSRDDLGKFSINRSLCRKYEDFLLKTSEHRLDGLKIVLDCANGAAFKVAPRVFRRLGAEVTAIASSGDGMKINDKRGALYPSVLIKKVRASGADVGFAFDGDADRLIGVDKSGRIIDGDMMIYMLAKYMRARGRLRGDTVVGTSHTNMGIENALKSAGIRLLRTDIGDKYVLARLIAEGLTLGGEQSGHIILKDLHTTGDGILSAIAVANMMIDEGRTLCEMLDCELYPQVNLNITVGDKMKIMGCEALEHEKREVERLLLGKGRVMIRASGTEPKIRIMVESESYERGREYAAKLGALVEKIDKKK